MSKVVLITGASSGMGHAGAILLASEGHKVYAGARRMDRMADLAESTASPPSRWTSARP